MTRGTAVPGGLSPRESLRLDIDDGMLHLPANARSHQSGALLELEFPQVASPSWRSPSLEVTAPGVRFRQYCAPDHRGLQLLNLSPAFATHTPGEILRLRARGVSLPQYATLHLFDPLELQAARLLVIAPHPDDAEIACFGLYAQSASWIVTLTAGERGMAELPEAARDRGAAARRLARLRVDDSLSIPLRAGVSREHCLNLAFPDGALEGLWRRAPQPTALLGHDDAARAKLRRRNPAGRFSGAGGGTCWPALVAELTELIAASRPTHIACPHPLLDSHPDHVFAAIAIDAALSNLPDLEPLMLMYVVHSAVDIRYPFGNRGSLLGPPPARDDWLLGDFMHSHPLDERMRTRKLAAIAANHDLQRLEGFWSARRLARRLRAGFPSTEVTARSLRARGHRPNEFYFVALRDTFRQICATALSPERRPEPVDGARSSRVRVAGNTRAASS